MDIESKDALNKIEDKLASKCAKENREELEGMKFEERGINSGRKLCPKSRDPPTAMCDLEGNLVTNEV